MAKRNESAAGDLRRLPSVDALLKDPELDGCVADAGRKVVVDSIRRALDQVREVMQLKSDSMNTKGADAAWT